MFTILNKQMLTPDVKRLDIRAESVAAATKPGQFVVVIPREKRKWIPLPVMDANPGKGVITIIFKEIGSATRELGAMAINEAIFSVTGPFGNPARIEKYGNVLCASSGLGTARILPICRAFKNAGNKVTGIIEGKNRREMMLEPQMRLACHKLVLAASDGLYERRTNVKEVVAGLIHKEKVHLIYAVGPMAMMRDVVLLAREKKIPARVQLTPLIQCGRGLCGSCRVQKDDNMVLVCQHGPEFDAHELGFETVQERMQSIEDRMESPPSQEPVTDAIAKFFPGLLRKFC